MSKTKNDDEKPASGDASTEPAATAPPSPSEPSPAEAFAQDPDRPRIGTDGKEIKYLEPGEVARQGSQICPYHNAICLSKTETVFTRFYCPVPHCTFAPKVARPKAKPPIEDAGFSAR